MRVSAHRNDPSQPAPLSLRRWAPAFASPSSRRFQTWRWTTRKVLTGPMRARGHGSRRRLTTSPACSRAHDAVPAPGVRIQGPGWPHPAGGIPHPGRHRPACCRGATAASLRPNGQDTDTGDTTWNRNYRPANSVPAPSAVGLWPAARTGTAPTPRACTAENSSTRWLLRMTCPRGNGTTLHPR